MPDWEMLNTERHAALRVRSASAEGRHFAQVVPAEFARVATRCPILLTKHPETGAFYAGALFGFVAGENLLVDDDGAFEGPTPFDVERQGFFITDENIVIDRDHPRFGAEGMPLFDEDGGATDALKRVQHALSALHVGLKESDRFMQTVLAMKLVEPIDVSLAFDDGERITLEGLYTISRDALSDLPDADVLTLYRSGDLALIHILSASLQQIPVLAKRRNARL